MREGLSNGIKVGELVSEDLADSQSFENSVVNAVRKVLRRGKLYCQGVITNNMGFSTETRNDIYDKTSGLCHLCGIRLAFKNYGRSGARAAFSDAEIDAFLPKVLKKGEQQRSIEFNTMK